jgi:NAD(P)-dependent dehydrogenase (short-subunit alcohol dehydrogenase family)
LARLDVKFNNAGVNKPMNFMDVTEDNWNFIMGVNGLGCLIGMQEAARQMIARVPAARSSTPPRLPAARGMTMLRHIAPRNSRWCR